jgi:hypothetical protein
VVLQSENGNTIKEYTIGRINNAESKESLIGPEVCKDDVKYNVIVEYTLGASEEQHTLQKSDIKNKDHITFDLN